MIKLNINNVIQYVEQNIGDFHQRRLDKVNNIKLKEVLATKNPYLFKAKNVTSSSEIVGGILDAFLSSSEEGIFGNWLERLAIFIKITLLPLRNNSRQDDGVSTMQAKSM